MSRKQAAFFASGRDLRIALEAANSKVPFCLVSTDLSIAIREPVPVCASDELSRTVHGNQVLEQTYLLVRPGAEVKIRMIEQKNGEARMILDQVSHPESVVLRPGGDFNDGVVIAGQIGTASDDPWSLTLYAAIVGELKRSFSKVRSYYVGPSARSVLDSGGRLTANVKSPRDYDLRI